ncbi:MAG: hypothetical protein Q4F71_04260 [Paracoccus sp. (in: a-proteobacteria)]|nr:hypothetical protein [Paracoccus sp. (in: a-proteobacteria)]
MRLARSPLMLAPLAALMLASCAEPGYHYPRTPVGPEICAQGPSATLAGRNVGDFAFARGMAMRQIQPGARAEGPAVPNRLTLHVDDKGWITRAYCG